MTTWRHSPLARCLRFVLLIAPMTLASCGGLAAGGHTSAPTPTAGPTMAPPTSFADWVARDGYNGDSTLRQINKMADWMVANPTGEVMVYIQQDISAVDRLVQWIDIHPATPCWADYRAATRDSLGMIQADFANLRLAAVAGNALPLDIIGKVGDEANAAFKRPEPKNCA